jgi:hypothetical protein
VDSQYLWQVDPVQVRVTPIHTVREARGTHHLTNGAYNYTGITLSAPEGSLYLQLNNRVGADDVLMFVNACAHLRASSDPGLREAFEQSPELLSEIARRIIDNRTCEGVELGQAPSIPRPTGAAARSFAARNASLGAAVAAAFLIGMFAFPPLGEFWADEHRYSELMAWGSDEVYQLEEYLAEFPEGRHAAEAQVMLDDLRFDNAEAEARPEAIEAYLNDFPQGRHAAEAQTLLDDVRYQIAKADPGFDALESYVRDFPQGRHSAEAVNELDDRRFAVAEQNATQSHSPAALRDYLADLRNSRHRNDAQKLIDGFYDEAIARVKSLGEGQETVDPQLSGGLLALLESLKTSSRPVATIGFASQQELAPEDESHQLAESQAYAAYLEQNPGLSDIAGASLDNTAILPLGEAFRDEQVRRREAFILDRLRETISKVIDADIIAFEPAAEGQTPMVRIEYRSYSVGSLYLYTQTTTDYLGSETTTPRGLLRGYLVDWKLTIQPKTDGETFVYELASKPGESLYYRPDSSDPDWAVYAVLMYSAFHDFSGKLISGMGLEAPSPPVSFSFADATGSHDTSPAYVPSAYPAESNTDTNTWPSYGDFSSGLTPSDYNLPTWGDTNQFNNNPIDPNQFGADSNAWNSFNSPLFQKANAYAQEAAAALNGTNSGIPEETAIDPSALQLDFSAFGGPTYDFNNLSGTGASADPLTPPQIPGWDSAGAP